MHKSAALLMFSVLSGCGVAYDAPPGLNDADSVVFHNALGERRYCASPEPPSAGMQAVGILAGGIGGVIGNSAAVRRAHYNACSARLRADGLVPVNESPTMSADEIRLRRAQQAAADAAETDRRNAAR